MTKKRPMVAAFDLVVCLASAFMAMTLLMTVPTKSSAVETLGYYAVTSEWPKGSMSDIDLYVRAPDGSITFFASSDHNVVYLEHDDLGLPDPLNQERVLVRSVLPGEYVVNIQAYDLQGPTRVTIRLWRLRGDDRVLATRTVLLTKMGQEETIFRFVPPHTFHKPLSARFVR